MINVKVKPNKSENSVSLLKRFSRRVQGAGILTKAKSIRFKTRAESSFTKKKGKLRKIEKRQKIEKMLKMGQVIKRKKRRF
jgi:hypothetical protein